MKKKKLFITLGILSVPIALFYGHSKLIDNGFCYSTGKFFSELDQEELINRGIEIILVNHRPMIVGDYKYGDYIDPIIPYESVEHFRKVNPNCCYFHKGEFDPSDWYPAPFSRRINGDVYGYLVMKYEIRRTYPNEIPENKKKDKPPVTQIGGFLMVSTCGKVDYTPNWAYY